MDTRLGYTTNAINYAINYAFNISLVVNGRNLSKKKFLYLCLYVCDCFWGLLDNYRIVTLKFRIFSQ